MNKKIILIEDDEILSKVLYEELTEAGFNVTRLFDGEAGLDAVKSQKPDLVLLDLMLPKMHGFDVLTEIKKSPETSSIPLIILTMLGSDEDIKKGLRLGADDYIVKTQHTVSEIIEKIKNFLEERNTTKKSQPK